MLASESANSSLADSLPTEGGAGQVKKMANSNTSAPPSSAPWISALAAQHPEKQYLDLVRAILQHGEKRQDRTGTGTVSLFAPPQLRWPLSNNQFPLLTTKRVFFRGMAEELLWFIRGQTDGTLLSNKGVKIWDGNGSREFLDSRGLSHRRVGDLGPVYGFQWRHFGAPYVDADADYMGKGVDQLREVVDKICHAPTDRRIIMSAWNPAGELHNTLLIPNPNQIQS